MGTWDEGSFGNDTACDWSYGLEKVNDLRYVETTLDKVLAYGAGEMVPADAAECAVAAAEVIARLKGRWGEEDSYTETTDAWVRSHPVSPPPALVAKTVAALERIVRPPSELLDLWEEAEEGGSWVEAVAELKGRIGA